MFPLDGDGLYPDDRKLDWRQDEVGHAEHRKLYVVDGVVAWTGGAGIEDHFVNGGYHDVMVRVTGDIVRQAQAAFLTSFKAHGGPLPGDLSPYFPEPTDPGSTRIVLAQVIAGGHVAARQAIRELIDGARSRLDLMNPYFTDRDMLERILSAARRGVKVRLVASAAAANPPAAAAFKHRYADLLAAGVEIWELPDTVVHKGRRRGRHSELRDRQPRRLGALPRFRTDDDRSQRRSGEAVRAAPVRAGYRALAARTGAVRRPRRRPSWLWDKLTYFL